MTEETGDPATEATPTTEASPTEGVMTGETGDTEDPDKPDFAAMEACELGGCPTWLEFFAESEPYTMAPERICVFEGLRDGTTGRYTYEVDHEFGNGNYRTTTLIHVQADRKLTFVQHHVGYTDEGPFDWYDAAMTCTLRAPDFFDACPMTDPFDSECYWLPTPWSQQPTWFTDCAAMGPMCG